jgi:hypothetical protein
MRRILKAQFEDADNTIVVGGEPKFVDVQNDLITVWFESDTTQPKQVYLKVFGTGNELHPDDVYVGSVQMSRFVWHVYEVHRG